MENVNAVQNSNLEEEKNQSDVAADDEEEVVDDKDFLKNVYF